MTIAMEYILAWKPLPRVMMAVMCYSYLDVLNWFMRLPPDAMTSQNTALTAIMRVHLRFSWGMKSNHKSFHLIWHNFVAVV